MDINSESAIVREAYRLVKLLLDNTTPKKPDPIIIESATYAKKHTEEAYKTSYKYKNPQVMGYLSKGQCLIRWINVLKTPSSRDSSTWAYKVQIYPAKCRTWLEEYIEPLVYKDLVLDLSRVKLTYKNKSMTVSPGTREIIFLKLLMQRPETIVTFKTFAQELNLNAYSGDSCMDTSVIKDIQYVKRDFLKQVELETGLKTRIKLGKMIKSQRNIGYILKKDI